MVLREDRGPRDAEALVFVHGAGVGGWMWKHQLEALGAYHAIVVDLPDHGSARGEEFTGIETAADNLADFIRQSLPGGRAHLVGHGLGAKIVLELLSHSPETARSALVSSALVRKSALAAVTNSHALHRLGLWLLQNPALARAQAARRGFPEGELRDAFLSELAGLKAENLDRPSAAFAARLFLPPKLSMLSCPVLVTAGAREPRSMLRSLEDIVAAIPGATSAIVAGAGHSYPWTHPAAYNALLESFLSSVTKL